MRLQSNARKRLHDIRGECTRLQENLAILDEQIAFLTDVAADAELRAVVASTPLADRERREAAEDLRRLQRERSEVDERLAGLQLEQDRLLDRMLEERS